MRRVLSVNRDGTFLGYKRARASRERGFGSIVNLPPTSRRHGSYAASIVRSRPMAFTATKTCSRNVARY
jgi:hypothetical protein